MKKVSGNVYKTSGGSYYEDPLLALVQEIKTLTVDYSGFVMIFSEQKTKENRQQILEAINFYKEIEK